VKLSVQLYTVRDQLSEDPIATLRTLKEAGLNYVEGAGTLPGKTAAESRSILDDLGLKASGAHIGLGTLQDEFEKAIDEVKTLGCKYLILPWIGEEVYVDGWEKVGRTLNEIGQKVTATGLVFAYHNHAFEFENNGFATLYATADPAFVKAQLDIAWCQIGGEDPAAMIETLANRLPLVHLKDFDPDKTPQWTPAGTGKVNWDAVLESIAKGHVEFGAIELDESPGDPLEAVAESIRFFRSRGISE
jgi:sugar phosphate isomerase/epimerase